MIEDLRTDLRDMRKEQRDFYDEVKSLRLENQELKKQIIVLQNKIEVIEKKERRNNIIVSGVSIKEKEPEQIKQTIESAIERHLEIKCDISSITKINERMCKIEMRDAQEKEKVMRSKRKLRHVKQQIYINHDLTDREQSIQKRIRDEARKQRQQGKKVKVGYRIRDEARKQRQQGKKVKVGYQNLIVNGKKWIWEINEIRMGTWNLQGINEQGAVKTLIKDLKQYKVDILAVQINEQGAVKTLIKELKQYKVDILAVQETHLKEKSVQDEQGAVKTLIKELKQYKVDILAVQETHLKEKSVQEVDEYILYNSGGNDRRFGVGFAVNKNLAARVKRFESLSDKLCYITLQTKNKNLTIINIG
ncbi:hypothetical protein QE152_g19547 [Popillia japonica]|uniref:Endonuclease/exonuclease/phosphatase domain-containing protein n=1 Tax=Popillia japonica TaxID=7064 RepID=A0AAW1KQ81_POPJA